jgi:negative regulator of flagellin synthesis FlgM
MKVIPFIPRGNISMKISDQQSSAHLDGYMKSERVDRQAGGQEPRRSPAPPAAGDSVVLSPQARRIQRAKQLLERVPEVRADLVARLREAVREGRYRVDAERTASAIIREMLQEPAE